ncbi:DNA replication and repair protein RecF [Psychromonas sp. CNPT3]|uniref:DNA replication/repair protein RecF n=1 Tax=Psychromonas sp. CNPT3 TaxID=314282 RepID=UPI00006E790B|nr:DNA replication/repair protein RecF [Psychromonas sp. CNPT3]AGH79945.1 DNA replication and repair protein RecF [Psychromonas sp. CNPT3]
MPITKLVIHQFRNIHSATLHFNKQINVITGDNGSGKTALLEAIYFLGLGRSFRSHLSNRIITHEHPEFILFAEIDEQGVQVPIGLKKTRKGESILKINTRIATKLADLTQHLPLQLITPDSINLLSGSPKNRRAFLDWGVFYHDPLFYQTWARIKRLLKQRNAALKQCKTYNELQLWDNELCFLSTEISDQRQRYFQQLIPLIEKTIADFLPEFSIKMSFFCGWDNTNKSLQQYFIDNFERDKQLGYTTAGPQKADIRFKIGSYPLADVLSRGQLKLFVYALRLAQGLFLNNVNNKKCVFLIDDFSSELDQSKQQILAKHIIQSDAQLFISVIDKNHIENLFEQQCSVFHVKHGKITNID